MEQLVLQVLRAQEPPVPLGHKVPQVRPEPTEQLVLRVLRDLWVLQVYLG